MILVFFDKGCKNVVYKVYYFGSIPKTYIDEIFEKNPSAMYYEVFSEQEYKTKFE